MDGAGLEVIAIGLRNLQELAFDDFGNLFIGDKIHGSDIVLFVCLFRTGSTVGMAEARGEKLESIDHYSEPNHIAYLASPDGKNTPADAQGHAVE